MFFIISYPRSMTAWLADALSTDKKCLHEGLIGCRSVKDLREKMEDEGAHGNSDCANLFVYKELKDEFPDGKFIVILRDSGEVRSSLNSLGLDETVMDAAEELMKEVLKDGHPVIPFEMINVFGRNIWQHCINEDFDDVKWEEKYRTKITVDVEEMKKKVIENMNAFVELLG